MGTIGTGTEGNEQAVEERATDAWRSKNLVVLLLSGSSLGIQGGAIASTETDHLGLIGRFVWTEPCVGELLQLSDSAGLPRVQPDLMVARVIEQQVKPSSVEDRVRHGEGRNAALAMEEAAEQRPTDADGAAAGDDWRSRSLEVHLSDCGQPAREVRIENGRIASVHFSAKHLIGWPVRECPRVGEPLMLGCLLRGGMIDPFTVGDNGPVLVLNVRDLKEDCAAKEQPDAAPAAEQAAAASGQSAKSAAQNMDPLLSAFIDLGLLLTATGSLKAMEGGVRAFVGTASLIETMGGTAEERAESYRMMIGKIVNHSLFSKKASSPAEGSAAHVG